MKILILTDGKAGHENQSKAFARALGGEATLLGVAFKSRAAKAASYLLDHLGIHTARLFDFAGAPPKPETRYDVVLGTGSGTFYAAKTLARALGASCGVVLYPRGYRLKTFDCILAPAFDRPKPARNVIEIPANLVPGDEAFYEKGVADFSAHYRRTTGHEVDFSCRSVAVVIGGPNAHATLEPHAVRRQLETLFAENRPAAGDPRRVCFWVTTSRRTPRAVEEVVDAFDWDYKLIYSRDTFNPIPGFVARAGRLYVTAESTGMLSEACSFGRAHVCALDNLLPGPHKFRRFVDGLRAGGYLDGCRKIDLSDAFAAARKRLAR